MYARVCALLIAFAFGLTAAAGAQETTGSISGRVVDTQGLGVPGVNVTVTGPQGARSFVTDSEGNFRGPYLTPGTYTVRAELQGFKTVEQKNVNVSLGQTVALNMRMEVGGLTETVEVSGASPIIDTTRTTIGGTVDSDELVSPELASFCSRVRACTVLSSMVGAVLSSLTIVPP